MRNIYCTIYLITNIVNNKKYIGQTWYDLRKRLQRHGHQNKRGCPLLQRAITKYGKENFTIQSLAQCSDQNIADQAEQQCIEQYGTTDPNVGYNLTAGGQGDKPPMSEEMRQRISNKLTGIKRSPQSREKMSEGHEGYLERLTPEAKANLNASRAKKRKLTMEQANEIRRRFEQGEMQISLAEEYKVSNAVISLIVNNKTYINNY